MKRKQREKYSDDNLLRAIAEIRNKKLTYRAASNKYGILIATLPGLKVGPLSPSELAIKVID